MESHSHDKMPSQPKTKCRSDGRVCLECKMCSALGRCNCVKSEHYSRRVAGLTACKEFQ